MLENSNEILADAEVGYCLFWVQILDHSLFRGIIEDGSIYAVEQYCTSVLWLYVL